MFVLLQRSADGGTTENRTDLMAKCCDIVDALFELEESDINVLCGAANWKRLPNMNPVWLAQFETKLAQYDIALVDVKQTNFAINARVNNTETKENA